MPYFHAISSQRLAENALSAGRTAGRWYDPVRKWYDQMAGRVEVSEKFSWSAYLLNGPRGLVNFLPWVVLLPLAWRGHPSAAGPPPGAGAEGLAARTPYPGSFSLVDLRLDAAVARGLRWALAGCFVAVSLAPGGIPRYTLPLLVPAGVLLALTFTRLSPRDASALPGPPCRSSGRG